MAYTGFLAGSPVMLYPPGERFLNDYQEFVKSQFVNSPSYQTIKKESPFGSGSYINYNCRLNNAINEFTGFKLGDDFKTMLIEDLSEDIPLGTLYYFNSNYWLVTNAHNIRDFSPKYNLRRCNNALRWRTEEAITYSEPCVIDYKIATPRNKEGIDPVIPEGSITIYVQLNTRTKTIKENQRFLFGVSGNYQVYKIYGGGINNFNNLNSIDNTSGKLMTISLGRSYDNTDLDDNVNGIADYYKFPASASPVQSSVEILPNEFDILSGSTVTYTCYLMAGRTRLDNVFVFSVANSNVPTDHYTLTTIGDNSFSVKNKEMYLDSTLDIACTSGSTVRTINISLRGVW